MHHPPPAAIALVLATASVLAGAPAAADENPPTLPTEPVASWLGADVPGLDGQAAALAQPFGEDSRIWTGTLEELANAVALLDTTVTVELPAASGGRLVVLMADGEVNASAGWAAVEAAAVRARCALARDDRAARVTCPDDGDAPDDDATLSVMVTHGSTMDADALGGGLAALGLDASKQVRTADGAAAAMAMTLDDIMGALSPERLLGATRSVGGSASSTASEPTFETDADGRWIVPREVAAPLATDGGMRAARVVPWIQEGEIAGFKLYGLRRGSVFRALGLHNGDAVITLDGQPLSEPVGWERLLRAWLAADTVELTVVRRGQTRTLRYAMQGDPIELPRSWDLASPTSTRDERERLGITETEGRIELPRAYVDELRARMPDDARWRYVAGDDGELLGISGEPRRRGFATLIGLSRREVLVAIDGAPVVGPESVLALYRALATEDVVELTIAWPRRAYRETRTIHVGGPPAAGDGVWTLEHVGLPPSRDQRRAMLGIEVGSDTVELPRAAREALLDPDQTLALAPVTDDDGAVLGYRIDGWSHESLASVLGIGEHERLVAVDSAPLISRDAVDELLAGWLGRKRVELTLRDGAGIERMLTYVRVGPPLSPPARWGDAGVIVEPTRDEQRATMHIVIDGDLTRVPRDVLTALMFSPPHLYRRRGSEGFRASRRDDIDTWLLLGIRNDEGVTALDGQPLPPYGAADAIAEALRERSSVALTLTGDAGERTLVIEVVDG